jgi:hypothetical protein
VQGVGNFLDNPATSPAVLLASFAALRSKVTNELTPALADLNTGLTTFTTNTTNNVW